MFIVIELFNIANNAFGAKNSAHCTWMLVIIKFIVSRTLCTDEINLFFSLFNTDSSERSTSPVDDLDSEAQEPSRKKARTIFTAEQLRGLEAIFATQRYLSAGDRAMVARKLHLNEFQVHYFYCTNLFGTK